MATKRKRKMPPTAALVVTIACKLDGRPRALALRRDGDLIKGIAFDQRASNRDAALNGGVAIDLGNGETLHTALHALGVWSWGSSECDP